jgi:hypothetical protein
LKVVNALKMQRKANDLKEEKNMREAEKLNRRREINLRTKRDIEELRKMSNKLFVYKTPEHMIRYLDDMIKERLHNIKINAIEDAVKQDD